MVEAARQSDQVAPEDIARLTGIDGDHPVRQRNRLRKMGIKAELNAAHEVVCCWAWVHMAALPPAEQSRYLQAASANDDEDDIGLNLEALDGKS